MSLDRILAHVTVEAECWRWNGAVDKAKTAFPSPMLKVSQPKRRIVSARRYSYETHNQVVVPPDFVITATCKKSLCVNPAHLTAQKRGTQGHRLIGSWKFEHCKRGHEFSVWNTGIWKQGDPKEQRFCKVCARLRGNETMARFRAECPEHITRVRKARSEALRAWVTSLKTPCIHCQEDDPAVLDFHHRDPSTKLFQISNEAGNYSKAKLQVEIDKCDVICSNCHRKLHAAERALKVNPTTPSASPRQSPQSVVDSI